MLNYNKLKKIWHFFLTSAIVIGLCKKMCKIF